MTDFNRSVRLTPASTRVVERDHAIEAVVEQVKDLSVRAAQGRIGRFETFFHIPRETRATEVLRATGAKLDAMVQVTRAATELVVTMIEYRDTRVQYEAQTLALPYIRQNYTERVMNAAHIEALDRDTRLCQARVSNDLTTAERLTSRAKLQQLHDDLRDARSGRLMNGVRVDRDNNSV